MDTKQVDQGALAAYIECALWSSYGTREEDGSTFDLDSYDGDLAPSAHDQMASELGDFLATERVAELIDATGQDLEQAAHDFWLTRNGHGAGFWDRGYGPAGDELSKLAKAWGSCDLYVGDDGLVYAS